MGLAKFILSLGLFFCFVLFTLQNALFVGLSSSVWFCLCSLWTRVECCHQGTHCSTLCVVSWFRKLISRCLGEALCSTHISHQTLRVWKRHSEKPLAAQCLILVLQSGEQDWWNVMFGWKVELSFGIQHWENGLSEPISLPLLLMESMW